MRTIHLIAAGFALTAILIVSAFDYEEAVQQERNRPQALPCPAPKAGETLHINGLGNGAYLCTRTRNAYAEVPQSVGTATLTRRP